jgi:hypothetical protein
MLKAAGLVTDEQLRQAIGYQRRWGCRIGEALLELRALREDDLVAVTARQLGVRAVHIGDRAIPRAVVRLVPSRVVERHGVLPVDLVMTPKGSRLVVAFPHPEDLGVVDEVSFACGMSVEPVLAAPGDLVRAIARHHGFIRGDAVDLPPDDAAPMRLVDGRMIH